MKKKMLFHIPLNWLLSYAIVFIVPLLISYVMITITENILTEEINDRAFDSLTLISQNTDNLLIDNDSIFERITLNKDIQQISRFSNSEFETMRYLNIAAINALSMQKITTKGLASIAIYFQNIDTVITSEGAYSKDQYYQTYFLDSGITYEDWCRAFTSRCYGEYIPFDMEQTGKLCVSYSMINSVDSTQYNNVVLIYKCDDFLSSRGMTIEGSSVYILNENREQMLPLPRVKLLPETYLAASKGGESTTSLDGNTYISIPSKLKNWTYVYEMDNSVQMGRIQFFKYILIIWFLTCIILGAVLIFFYSRKNYVPIKNIADKINREIDFSDTKDANAIQQIEKSVMYISREKKKIENSLLQQKLVLQKYLLAKLLKGYQQHDSSVDEYFGEDFKSASYVVLLYTIENIDEIFYEKNAADESANYFNAQFIIMNIMDELISDFADSYYTDIEATLTSVVCIHDSGNTQVLESIKEAYEYAAEIIKREFNISFEMTASKIHSGLCELPQAYLEATEVLEYYDLLGENLVWYEDLKDIQKMSYYYPLEKETQLINCIKTGDYATSVKIMEEIFNENFNNAKMSLQMARCLNFNIVSTMIKTTSELMNTSSEDFTKFLDNNRPLDRLFACNSIPMLKVEITKILHEFCEYTEKIGKFGSKDLAEMVKQYIEENYGDHDLNVSQIADKLNMNRDYIARVFKTQTGIRLLDYLNDFRVQKACDLLENGNITVNEVAERTGFLSVRNFTRVFSKITGTTPGRYRSK